MYLACSRFARWCGRRGWSAFGAGSQLLSRLKFASSEVSRSVAARQRRCVVDLRSPRQQTPPSPPSGPPSLTIPRLSHAPSLDDFLTMKPEGEVALQMAKVTGFTQRNPHDGEAVSEPTDAYLGYDQKNLYVVFVCFDDPKTGARTHVAARRHLRRRPGRDHARHLSRPPPRLRLSDHAARRAVGRDLDRGLARGADAGPLRHFVRHGLGFARARSPTADSSSGWRFPSRACAFRRRSSRSGASFCIAASRARPKTRSGRTFPTKSKGASARPRRSTAWKEFLRATASN